MNKTYKLNNIHKSNLALDYRLGMDCIDYSARLIEKADSSVHYLATEQDVITEWADLARNALVGEYRESNTKCWVGHYEQFGMVMLNLAKMSRYRQNYRGLWDRWVDGVMDNELHHLIFTGPHGSEDRIFYRCWFRLLGHPDFLQDTLNQSEVCTYKLTELCLYIAFKDMNLRLLSLKQ